MKTAFEHFRAGRLREAEAACRKVLERNPGDAEALHLRGVLAHRAGRNDAAIKYIGRAIALVPDNAEFLYNLGVAQQVAGWLAEAEASYQASLRREPGRAEAHNNLGYTKLQQGRVDDALACFEAALRLRPDYAEALANRGEALVRRGEPAAAVDALRHALRLRSDSPEAHNHLGVALRELGEREEAEACFHQALRLRSDFGAAHANLGRMCEDRGRLEEAAARFRLALCHIPNDATTHNNLGNILVAQRQAGEARSCYERAAQLQPGEPVFRSNLAHALTLLGKLEEAEASCREALRLRPDYADAHHNLAITLGAQGRFDAALVSNAKALELKPEDPGARNCRALWWLQTGDFERGWPEYEWRWRIKGVAPREFSAALWDGSPLEGKTILIHAEQALGDTLQFIRYAPLVAACGGDVVVECQPALVPLLRGAPGIHRVIARGEPLPAHDLQVPLLSLPRVFRTALAAVPAEVPYLRADPALVEHWRGELGTTAAFKVGIAWQGNPDFPGDAMRSMPLAHFAPLARIPGVHLISLQKGRGQEQIKVVTRRFAVTDLGGRFDEAAGPFMDTAAVMKNLDLIITSDSAIAHLAGALGARVWVALAIGPDWRWLVDREDSPWYPTMRLFRQRRAHDWDEVFERIAAELRREEARRRIAVPPDWDTPGGAISASRRKSRG
jgi:Flp pilus assembly protein TadD